MDRIFVSSLSCDSLSSGVGVSTCIMNLDFSKTQTVTIDPTFSLSDLFFGIKNNQNNFKNYIFGAIHHVNMSSTSFLSALVYVSL